MSPLAYINIALAVIGLVMMVYSLRKMPATRCGEPLIGDTLVLVAYLLMINSYYMAQQSPYIDLARQAWHVFDMAVILNIIFHARLMTERRLLR